MLIKTSLLHQSLGPRVFLSFSLSLYFCLIPWSPKAGCVTQGILASFLLSLSHRQLQTTKFWSSKGPTLNTFQEPDIITYSTKLSPIFQLEITSPKILAISLVSARNTSTLQHCYLKAYIIFLVRLKEPHESFVHLCDSLTPYFDFIQHEDLHTMDTQSVYFSGNWVVIYKIFIQNSQMQNVEFTLKKCHDLQIIYLFGFVGL